MRSMLILSLARGQIIQSRSQSYEVPKLGSNPGLASSIQNLQMCFHCKPWPRLSKESSISGSLERDFRDSPSAHMWTPHASFSLWRLLRPSCLHEGRTTDWARTACKVLPEVLCIGTVSSVPLVGSNCFSGKNACSVSEALSIYLGRI